MIVFRKAVRTRLAKARKTKAAQDVLDRLNNYLNAAAPEPVYFLSRVWENQQQAISYKELREAVMRGYIKESTIAAWQQDYAVFVNDKLAPAWKDAMKQSAAELESRYDRFFFDPMTDAVRRWTAAHGAQWVQGITGEARSALSSMVGYASSGAWTVDELSRAIRPVIGLNQRQATANLNYYNHVKASLLDQNPTMKPATAAKKAREAALRYAGKQHRYRANTIAITELAFAYNKGIDESIKQCIEQGLMGETQRVWSTAADGDVCPICRALEGVAIGMDEEFLFAGHGQKQTPPAHPRCRCAVMYKEIGQTAVAPGQQTGSPPQTILAQPENENPLSALDDVFAPDLPIVPASEVRTPQGIPSVSDLQYKGTQRTGGAGKVQVYLDNAGQKWLFKPKEPYRAYAQRAGYDVQNLIDPDSAVEVGVGTLRGEFGAFQRHIQAQPGLDLAAWQDAADALPDRVRAQFQREHVTDWLLGNFDTSGNRFCVDDTGRLLGVHKEEALRYVAQADAAAMSYTYHPGAAKPPIYNTLFKRFASGDLDLNLQDTLPYIKRAEALPDRQYRALLCDYAEALHGKGADAEQLLDIIVERKANLRDTYRTFYSDLLTERTGKKQTFIWADESAEHMTQPLAAVRHTPETLKDMSLQALKQLGKSKELPYYGDMTKSQLISAISDPVKAPGISAEVRAKRLAAKQLKVQDAVAHPATPKHGVLQAESVFEDFGIIPRGRIGCAIPSDEGAVEGLNLSARLINIEGHDYYEVYGKLTERQWRAASGHAKRIGTQGTLAFEEATANAGLYRQSTLNMRLTLKTHRIETNEGFFEVLSCGNTVPCRGWHGRFKVRVPATGDGVQDAAAARRLLREAKLDVITKTPSADAERILKKQRLVWQHAPTRSAELSKVPADKLETALDKILAEEGIDARRIANMRLEHVFDGYTTIVEDGILDTYKQAGVKYLWVGNGKAKSVVRIVRSSGLIANNNRFISGLKPSGKSYVQDIKTGGSDSVFTRIAVQTKSKVKFDESLFSGNYQIMIDPKALERTDWYAYFTDEYGSTAPHKFASRAAPEKFISGMRAGRNSNNEVMFRHGVASEHFIGIACESEAARKALLAEFRAAGMLEVNGIAIENFVKVQVYL